MSNVICMQGIQGSGKSTKAKEIVKSLPGTSYTRDTLNVRMD